MSIDKTLNSVLRNLNLFESITEDEITSLISGILKASLIKVSLKTIENIPAGTLITGDEKGSETSGYISFETLFDYIFTGYVIPINTRIHTTSDKVNTVRVLSLDNPNTTLTSEHSPESRDNIVIVKKGIAEDFDLNLLYLSKKTNLEDFLTEAVKTPYLFFKNEFSKMCDNEYKSLNKKEENKALKLFKTAMLYGQLKFVGLKKSPGLQARGLVEYTNENVFEIRINLNSIQQKDFKTSVLNTISHEITHLGQYVTRSIYDSTLHPIDGIVTPRLYQGGPQPLTSDPQTGQLRHEYASRRHEVEARIKGSLRPENIPVFFNNISKVPEAEKFLRKMYEKVSNNQIKMDTVIALLVKHYFEILIASFDEWFGHIMNAMEDDKQLRPFIEDLLMSHLLDNKRVLVDWLEQRYGR